LGIFAVCCAVTCWIFSGQPKAYLNWLFFDENINFIPPNASGGGSSYLCVLTSGDGAAPLVATSIRVPKMVMFLFM
jgi:hypothetical protein